MPILLNTPWNPGNFDPGKSYTHAKIVDIHLRIRQSMVKFIVSYGVMDGGAFVPGITPEPSAGASSYTVRDTPESTPFTDLCAQLTNDGENVYDAIKRIGYAYLIANVPELAGTVE